MIQASNGGGAFFAGKGLKDPNASAIGSVALAMHVRSVAKYYGIPVVLHSDHCAKKLLPWFDGMLEADEAFFAKYGEPLFSSHMLDLSEEPDEENIAICAQYFKRMVKMKIWLEMEIGITGGEEDGVNNEDVDPEKLYTTPQQVYAVHEALSKIGSNFSIAAAFGNVHGVYKPGNVKLSPEKLGQHQAYTKKMLNSESDKPLFLVMHGGSGSTDAEIKTAVTNGVVKMNIDTDTQVRKSIERNKTGSSLTPFPRYSGPTGTDFARTKRKSVPTCRAKSETRTEPTSPTRSSTILVSGSAKRKRRWSPGSVPRARSSLARESTRRSRPRRVLHKSVNPN